MLLAETTDIHTMERMLQNSGIEFDRERVVKSEVYDMVDTTGYDEQGTAHAISLPVSRDVIYYTLTVHGGYSGFYCTMTFNEEGKLTEMGSYEC